MSCSLVLLMVMLSFALPVRATDLTDVAASWRDGDFDTARSLLDSLPQISPTPPAVFAWRQRLSADPAAANAAFQALTRIEPDGAPLINACRLDAAWTAWGRSDHQAARHSLAALEVAGGAGVPGAKFLSALIHLHLDASGDAAAEFADVPAAYPEFAWARVFMGRLAQGDGQHDQARKEYAAATTAAHAVCNPEVLLARWEGLIRDNPSAARLAEQELARDHSGSLALIRLRDLQRRHQQLLNAPQPLPVDSPDAEIDATDTDRVHQADMRFTIQLGAYRSRESALSGLAIYQQDVPAAEMIEVPGRDGQRWYKVVVGRYATREEAAAQVAEFQRTLVPDALVMRLPTAP